MSPAILCIMGPTASGKSQLAQKLAQQYPIEIISVDSTQVYRGLDIGSAKPSAAIQEQIAHHLIDVCQPNDIYDAARFAQDANQAIADILQRQKIPCLVGGTHLYFRALHQGLSPLPKASAPLRAQLQQDLEALGGCHLHQRLQRIDPEAAQVIKPQDSQRLIRALEVYHLTGKPLTSWWQENRKPSPYHYVNVAYIPEDREQLHEKIAKRFRKMLSKGLIAEVAALMAHPSFDRQAPAFRSVGYRQVISFLKNELTKEEMMAQAIIATRQLAKRQITWLRGMDDLERLSGDSGVDLLRLSEKINQ